MIDIQSQSSSSLGRGSSIVLFVTEKSKDPLGLFLFGSIARRSLDQARLDGFEGKFDQVSVVHPGTKSIERFIFVGLGAESDVSLSTLRKAGALVARKANALKLRRIALRLPTFADSFSSAQAVTEGILLGLYQFTKFQTKPSLQNLASVVLITKDAFEGSDFKQGIRQGLIFAESVNLVRDLVNYPPSDMDPLVMADYAKKSAGKGVAVKIYRKAEIKKLGMGGLLGVNRGSAKDPIFLHMIYRPAKGKAHRRVGICGKGITFDSGGLSLKPAKSMETMKDDMSGAATVISLMRALAKLQPAIEVHGFAPITENMPGGDAVKPGDVLKTLRGKTIEVLNTDAEGRLVLSDALSFACRQNLDEVIDIATLTGACVVALGPKIAGLMGNSLELQSRLKSASEKAGEKLWPLPLDKEYEPMLKSHVADIKNIGPTGVAGTILGGLFLKSFVDETMPWAHLDIASTAWSDEGTPLSPPGATGVLVRTLLTYLTQPV